VRLNSTGAAPTLADQGSVAGDDIAQGTAFTYFPSIAVNRYGDAMLGFSASAPTIFASSYYAIRAARDAAGSMRPSALLRAGTDFYIRTFSSSTTATSRWGDYSGAAVDPVDECFWVFNQHAMARGTPTTVGGVTEDGRWATAYGKLCGVALAAPRRRDQGRHLVPARAPGRSLSRRPATAQ
jgi:hypothetical protein